MKKNSTTAGLVAAGLEAAWEDVSVSFERFCLTAGMATLTAMMEVDAAELCGARHGRKRDRRAYRWAGRRASLDFTAARSALYDPACVPAVAPSWGCRAGRRRKRKTGWASGR